MIFFFTPKILFNTHKLPYEWTSNETKDEHVLIHIVEVYQILNKGLHMAHGLYEQCATELITLECDFVSTRIKI